MIDPALLSGIIKLTILLLIQYASGSLVFYKGVKVNYTRKINHFALFFVPMFIDNIIPVQPSIELLIIGSFFAAGNPSREIDDDLRFLKKRSTEGLWLLMAWLLLASAVVLLW